MSVRAAAPEAPVGLKLRMTAEAATGLTGRRTFAVVTKTYDALVPDERVMVVLCSGSRFAVRVVVWTPLDCTSTTFTSAELGPGLKTFTSTDATSAPVNGIRRVEPSDAG